MSEALVRQAFESTLKTWADAQVPVVPVEMQNVALAQAPAPLTRYLRAFLLPGATESADIGRANRRFVGVFQISIVEPAGKGAGDAWVFVGALRALFPPATPIVVSGLSVWAVQPLSAATPINERDRFVVPCSIQYRSDFYP